MRLADGRGIVRYARFPLVIAAAVLVPVAVHQFNDYWVSLSQTAAITAIVLLSIGILTERAGMLAVAPLAFSGIGAWAISYYNFHVWAGGFFFWLLLAGVATVPFGLLVGLPALRLRGINLAVITLTFAVAMYSAFNNWDFPGTLAGVFVERPNLVVGDNAYFLMCWIVFVIFALIVWIAGRRPFGSAWRAIARSERATAAMGTSVPQIKLGVFMLSAFMAGVAGALMVGQISTETPDTFSPAASLLLFALAIMVGAGYPEGAVVGGALSAFMPEFARDVGLPQDVGNILFVVGAVQVLKVGTSVAGGWRATARRLSRRRPDAAAGTAAVPPPPPPQAARGVPSAAADSPPALRARQITVRFGNVVALDHLDLVVPPSTVHGLIGPNGAGKSTLVDAVTGFIRRYEGSIEVGGGAIDGLNVHRRVRAGVRRTFQQERTIPELSAGDYVRLASRRASSRDEIAAMLAFIGAPAPDLPIAEIDVGARRLIEIVGCLAARPQIVLLDEPAAGLAQAESAQLAARIAEIPGRFGCAVLLIEHDMEVISAACSTVTVLDFGREIATGAPAEVLEMGSVVSAYLGDPGVAVG